MAQSAAALNQWIRDHAGRTDITDVQVYKFMNAAKRDLQLFQPRDGRLVGASPLDFMRHRIWVLLGSGCGTPGTASSFPRDQILLPPNCFQVLRVKLVTNPVVPDATTTTIWTTNTNFWRPSSGVAPNRYPLLSDKGTAQVATDLGLASYDESMLTMVDVPVVGEDRLRATVDEFNPYCVMLADQAASSKDYAAQTAAMSLQYAITPWAGKVLQFHQLPESDGTHYARIEYYRTIWEYNEASWELDPATIQPEDIVTRTAEDYLLYASMRRLAIFEFDETRAGFFKGLQDEEWRAFRGANRGVQAGAAGSIDRRLTAGTRVIAQG